MRHKRNKTIFLRILLPLLLVAVLQTGVLFGLLWGDGVFEQLHDNATDMLSERTQNKHQSLQSDMTSKWTFLSSTTETVQRQISAALWNLNKTDEDIHTDASLNASLVSEVAGDLITRLRGNGTTGVFLVLDGPGIQGQANTRSGIYIRDADPTNASADNSDLLLLHSLPPLSRALDLSLDSYWKAVFSLDGPSDYWNLPIQKAKAGGATNPVHYGYWCGPFSPGGEGDPMVITYALPLILDNGNVIGALGVELSLNYLVTYLNNGEYAHSGNTSYFLGYTLDEGKTYQRVVTAGAKFKQFFNASTDVISPREPTVDGIAEWISPRNGEIVYGSVFPLHLYNPNTPFVNEQWALIGMQDAETLFAFGNRFAQLMELTMGLSLLLGVLMAFLSARGVVLPITRLVAKLRHTAPDEPLLLPPIGISEIDTLADSITSLNQNVMENASRISKIITLTGLPVGVFELRDDSEAAFCSDGFFTLLSCEKPVASGNLVPKSTCEHLVGIALQNPIEDDIYRIDAHDGERYVRIKQQRDAHGVIGTILDMTSEVRSRRRLEHERDYDLLTGILNRRAFESRAEDLFAQKNVGMGALLMLDLDNLKFLNDTYGHDCGDAYIQLFAKGLEQFQSERCIVARRSGDEFYVLFHGYPSRTEIHCLLREIWPRVIRNTLPLPDGSSYRMRASGGIAWCPDDANDLITLIRYADFAMYRIKHSAKGMVGEFDLSVYQKESYLLNARAALDRLIDEHLLHYAYQPLVDAHTGEVMEYELLMRSDVDEFSSPDEILQLAKSQGKLHSIERLTWQLALQSAQEMQSRGILHPDVKVFVNSIANQKINKAEEQELSLQYGDLLPRVVMEVTESEDNNMAFTHDKLAFIHEHGGGVAIDDFGTGYNSELALMQIRAEYVKLDISFVRGVDHDTDKQALIRNLISYAKQRGIAVLAEGVETKAEMLTLIGFGVDYLQGYYLGRPERLPAQPSEEHRQEILRAAASASAAR